jgi:hypothetical protein
MCFNGVKTYQLGWYSQYHLDLSVNENFEWNGNLIGFAEKASATTSSDKMIIRIITSTIDIYIHFNRRIGMNIHTEEAGDQVLVATRPTGVTIAEVSMLLAKLTAPNGGAGSSTYTMRNLTESSQHILTIRVLSITNTTIPARANVLLQFGPPVPVTPSPTTLLPTVLPSDVPSVFPTEVPTELPSMFPTPIPTVFPTPIPTVFPTPMPTFFPTPRPTTVVVPPTTPTTTKSPTMNPTIRRRTRLPTRRVRTFQPSLLCNNNRKCDLGENCKTCPKDCYGTLHTYCCVGGKQHCNHAKCQRDGRTCGKQ